MQVSKTFAGEVTLESAMVKRRVSYGVETMVNVYPSKVDTLNNIIADFLRSTCGVDAWYGSGGDVEDSFLWIYGVPFLFLPTTKTSGSTTYADTLFYGPGYASSLAYYENTSTHFPLFNSTTGKYSFGIVFSGNPRNGFCLRFKQYNSAYVSISFTMRFMKATNLINGADAVVFSGKINIYSSSTGQTTPAGMNGIDLSGPRGMVDISSFSSADMTYTPLLQTKPIHKTHNEGALPLVPLCVGPYRVDGIYLRPTGFSLPSAMNAATEVLPEITISGRSFLLTNSDSFSSNFVNMGLIETT